jgi:hypothetical protein
LKYNSQGSINSTGVCSIVSPTYPFLGEEEAIAVEKLTREDVLDFYKKFIKKGSENRLRKLIGWYLLRIELN